MKVIALFIAALISIISAYVSYSVMTGIMFVYGLIAVGFELAKPFLIHMTGIHYRVGHTNKAVITGVLGFALCCASVFCSVSALETGVNTLKTDNSHYALVKSQIDVERELLKQQTSNNQTTAASKTSARIAALMAELPESTNDTVVTRNTLPMALSVSVLAEAVVAAVLMCIPSESAQRAPSVHIETINANVQINVLAHVRESILKGETKPSFRGVSENFKRLRREDVRTMFTQMLEAGELEPLGKGYKLA